MDFFAHAAKGVQEQNCVSSRGLRNVNSKTWGILLPSRTVWDIYIRSGKTNMFRTTSTDQALEPRLQELFVQVSRDVFGPDEELLELDFATIEQRAHEVGRRIARQLAEEAAAKQAQATNGPQPCPDCQRPCLGSITTRELDTQDGAIELQEARCECS